MTLLKSWVVGANTATSDFPLNNLPYGVFSTATLEPRCGVAIGEMILDMAAAEAAGLVTLDQAPVFDVPFWNELMELGPEAWTGLRARLTQLLAEGARERAALEACLVPIDAALMHLPFLIAEYTDFYSGRNHAFNIGTILRGPENALPPNWLSMPIGYNGRASSVVVSGTEVRRPWGQLKPPGADLPHFAPSERFDFELELGAVVGQHSKGMVSVAEADAMIFGYVLLNDWSARDIQGWEYQPLGPFQAKATATTISPWIVTAAALAPFRVPTPARERPLLPYLAEPGPMLYDIALEASLAPAGRPATTIARTNYREMYYSAAQQLCHHTTSGCPMTAGDLLGSGTISGADKGSFGSLMELSWGGTEPVTLDSGETRAFLEDGDTVILTGHAAGDGYRIGFGACTGKILPAVKYP